MDLISWSLSTIDKIFSTRRAAEGEPACPEGTHLAGYVMNAWGKWNVMCLSMLSVEDVEDVYLFALIFSGALLFGVCGVLVIRKLVRLMRKNAEDRDRAMNAMTLALTEQTCKLDYLLAYAGGQARVPELLRSIEECV